MIKLIFIVLAIIVLWSSLGPSHTPSSPTPAPSQQYPPGCWSQTETGTMTNVCLPTP